MSKRAILGIIMFASLISQAVYGGSVYSNDFSGLSSLADAGWILSGGDVSVVDGVAYYGNRKAAYVLDETYALDQDTSASNHVDALWMRVRIKTAGDSDSCTIRLGFGNSSITDVNNYGRYASVSLKADSDLSTIEFTAINMSTGSASSDPADAADYVDVYCKVYNNPSSNLVVDAWYNPVDPENLGAADVSMAQPYDATYGGRVIDRLEINAWGTSKNQLIDDIEVWSDEITDSDEDLVYFDDFSGSSTFTDVGWTVSGGDVSVSDGVVYYGNRKAAYVFDETYALDQVTSADNNVEELWLYARLRTFGDSDSCTIRLGLGNSSLADVNSYCRYASVSLKADSDLSTIDFRAISMNGGSASSDPTDAGGYVDVYCRLSNDESGDLTVDAWYNPTDPDNLDTADVSVTKPYDSTYGDLTVDRIEINAWGTSSSQFIDTMKVWAVTPEPYVLWESSWGTDIGSLTNDYDGDLVNNLAEYALGGNPTNAQDHGLVSFDFDGSNMVYTYPLRSDDTTLIYTLKMTDDLVSGVWSNAGFTVEGTNVTGDTMNYVTNTISVAESKRFIKLEVQKN